MKTNVSRLLRLAATASLFALLPICAKAKDAAASDPARTLEMAGSIRVESAGPYVEIGSYQIQVRMKLGKPTQRLSDGSWLYPNYVVNDSEANGTLIVRFTNGRVSELGLLSPAKVVALQSNPLPHGSARFVTAQGKQ